MARWKAFHENLSSYLCCYFCGHASCRQSRGDQSPETQAYDRPEYAAIKHRLAQGWNTWNSSDVLEEVLLPEGLSVHLAFESNSFGVLDRAMLGPIGYAGGTRETEWSRPGLQAFDGSYSELELTLKGAHLKVEAA